MSDAVRVAHHQRRNLVAGQRAALAQRRRHAQDRRPVLTNRAGLARPGGNITGVMQYEPSVTGKWLTMLKEIAPSLTRVAFMINPQTAPFYNYYLGAAEPSLSQSLGIELVPTFVENPTEINRAIESFARVPNGGLLVPPDVTTFVGPGCT
jgi:ABC-type uncharacterized transport system substrate-binding protein